MSVLGHTESNGLGIARQDVANTLESVGSANQPGWSVNSENAADGQLVVAATLRSGGDGEVPSSRGENLIRTVFGFQNQDLAHAIRSNPSKADKPDSSTYVVAPTLRGFGHGWQGQHNDDVARIGMVRRLTPTECERLQGFPDGWTLLPDGNTPDSPRYRALGNAVAVPVAEWIGWRIIEAMKEVAS